MDGNCLAVDKLNRGLYFVISMPSEARLQVRAGKLYGRIEGKRIAMDEKKPEGKKTVKKRGRFARFLERLAKENEKRGGQACVA